MRTAIVNYFTKIAKSLQPLTVVEGLPWVENGQPLYYKNKRHIYVDLDQLIQTTALNALDGSGATDEQTTVRAYFVTDAKQPIPNYETIVSLMTQARNTTEITGVIQRLCRVSTRMDLDQVVTEFEFSFVRLTTP
jgi:hypothetical protein